MLTFALIGRVLCERSGTGTKRAKNSPERSGLWSGERRPQKWALTRSGKTTLSVPLRSNALHRSNRVNADKITTGVLYTGNRLFGQSAVRQYNNQSVLADLTERYSVSVPPVTNNIYRSAVPAPKYLPERRSAAFRHHYSLSHLISVDCGSACNSCNS